jgi:hypothetical protein
MDEQQQSQRLADVDREARVRFGADCWTVMCGSMGRQGVNRDALAAIINQGDAVSQIGRIGQEALLLEMMACERTKSSEFQSLDDAYRSLRNTQRQEHAERRGRR